MYNYLKDNNLIFIYEYLLSLNMFDEFIEDIVNETKAYKEMLKNIKEMKKGNN